MTALVNCLFIMPLLTGILLLIFPFRSARWMVIPASFLLAVIAGSLFLSNAAIAPVLLPQWVNEIVTMADALLLLYFGWLGWRQRNIPVGLLALLQFIVLLYLFPDLQQTQGAQLVVDRLTLFMFLLINLISGVIAVYSLQYIEVENCTLFRKKYFFALLFGFITVMNLLVAADNLEYFFLFFELTTLASFLFIRFRKDTLSVSNAFTALWMNQVGGLSILLAMLFLNRNYYGITYSSLLSHASDAGILLPLALLSMAALVKGAQMPFSKWLLDAMVAPTPVSALLHASTMVKIAPFMLLRLSPALRNTPVAMVVVALTAVVFVAAAIEALSQDNFKRILAHSTISLLGLMMLLSAIGSPLTLVAAMILILFHGISKCMLFLNAGILENVFHLKQTSDMERLGESGPLTVLMITIGFLSLLLPPFGAFLGKWLSIESLGEFAKEYRIFGALIIAAVASGGAILTLLYFKVLGSLITRSGQSDRIRFEKTGTIFNSTLFFLLALLLVSTGFLPLLITRYLAPATLPLTGINSSALVNGWSLQMGNMVLPMLPLLLAFVLLPGTVIASLLLRFGKVDCVNEYACGEKVQYSFSSFYFSTEKASPYFLAIGILFFLSLIIVALP